MSQLTINVTYKNDTHIFSCLLGDFVSQVKDHFNIGDNIVLYEVKKNKKKKRIQPFQLHDIMVVEVVPESKSAQRANGQRFLEDYEIGESSKTLTNIESISKKMKDNKPLSGIERQHCINIIGSRKNLKRKRSDNKSVSTWHKGVQVNIKSCKDASQQTDTVDEPDSNSSPTDEKVIDKMKKISNMSRVDNSEIHRLMEMSFPERRIFISKKPFVKFVKEKYPLLFCFEEVLKEVDRIFSDGKCQEFLHNVQMYAPFIMQKADKDNQIYRKTSQLTKKFSSHSQKQYAIVAGSLLLMSKVFREEPNFLQLQDHSSDPGTYPHISAPTLKLADLLAEECLLDIVVETTHLCRAPSLPEAILCLVGAYYIFDIEYNPSCYNTLVAMEKLFLAGNETVTMDSKTSELIRCFKLKAMTSSTSS